MSADVIAAVHAIRWEFDNGSVRSTVVCYATDGADCRLTSVSCECEQWGEIQRRDDGTIWHHIVDYGDSTEPVWHEVKAADYCNVALFINETDFVDECAVKGTAFLIGEHPIDPVWDADSCDWKLAALTPAREDEAAIKAAALREAANECRYAPADPQKLSRWLRDRADRIESTEARP